MLSYLENILKTPAFTELSKKFFVVIRKFVKSSFIFSLLIKILVNRAFTKENYLVNASQIGKFEFVKILK